MNKPWGDVYPYTLDNHLSKAILEAYKNDDMPMVKRLWEAYVSYRKSDVPQEFNPDIFKAQTPTTEE